MGITNDNVDEDNQPSNEQEEKIFVSIRLRPLNEKELAYNDVAEWECINSTTILYKNSLPERSTLPAAYTFDRVFGGDCSTRQVYEEAAKRVALSVVNGINSSIFAYGQTSSGKTYTMCGITEYTVADIYGYIQEHTNREFVLKFSAMEIYNEAVRDLLSSDPTPLRLLDDPERGTVVEKITEVALRDWSHLKELLSACEAQRKVGETSLNEMSSRSHQILRLTVDSSAREFKRSENSSILAATVNFVDLAGSERASQTLSAGTRLKEGCHINRSLLTLGTVIRKLSKGKNGHVPYRDSKLTRILQNSLGGNARTAIICTMSPAHSHVEQSRNTLLFASCAKQVSTNARVNVVMSEKALVKQLKRELARLENQLKNLGSLSNSCDSLALKEKELLIEKMDKEIRELTEQRDQAQFRLQNLKQSAGEYQISKPWDELSSVSEPQEKVTWLDEYSASEVSETIDPLHLDVVSSISHFSDRSEGLSFNKHEEQFPEPSDEQFLSDDTSPRMFIEKYFGPDPTQGWEMNAERIKLSNEITCKEVRCIEIDSMRNLNSDSVSSPDQGLESIDIHHDGKFLKPTVEEQKNVESSVDSPPMEQCPSSSDSESSDSRSIDYSRSRSCGAVLTTVPLSPNSEMAKEDDISLIEKDSIESLEYSDTKFSGLIPSTDDKNLHTEYSQETFESDSVDGEKRGIEASGLDDVVVKTEKQFDDDPVLEAEETSNELENDRIHVLDGESDSQKAPSDCSREFEMAKEDDTPSIAFEKDSIRSLEHDDGKFSGIVPVADGKNPHREHPHESFESDFTDGKEETIKVLGLDDMVLNSEKQFSKDLVLQTEPTSNELEKDTIHVLDEVHDPQKASLDSPKEFEMAKENDTPLIAFGKNSIRSLEHNGRKFYMLVPVPDGKNLHREYSHESFKRFADENEETIKVLGLNDVGIKSEKQFSNNLVLAAEPTSNKLEKDTTCVLDEVRDPQKAPSDWSMEFEKQRAEIVQLWDACNIPMVHRTYFFLVFKGDPSDSIYMEVELRRLSFLKVIQRTDPLKYDQASRALYHEREMLSKLMLKKLSMKEREILFQKWGIELKTKKRRLQLCRRLWTDMKNMDHIKESAALVAKLVGIVDQSHVPKEIVGLSFSTPQLNFRSFSWKRSMPSLV